MPGLPSPEALRQCHASMIQDHREWLRNLGDPARLKAWDDDLESSPESALCEAYVRHLLGKQVECIEPAEDLSTGGPDFHCVQRGHSFYVESTCITISAATRASELPYLATNACSHRLLTQFFKSKCLAKARQCSRRQDAPCLLAIGTFHPAACDSCFDDFAIEMALTSEPLMTPEVEVTREDNGTETIHTSGETKDVTDLKLAAFMSTISTDKPEAEFARRSISGLLLCGLAYASSPTIIGALNIGARRLFDRRFLPTIDFCRLSPGYDNGIIRVEWSEAGSADSR